MVPIKLEQRLYQKPNIPFFQESLATVAALVTITLAYTTGNEVYLDRQARQMLPSQEVLAQRFHYLHTSPYGEKVRAELQRSLQQS